jgi:predicted DsbA family dithiol-disulfide isomerase
MYQRLYAQMEQWATGDDPDTALEQLAADLKLDRDQVSACLRSRKALERVLRDLYDGQGIVSSIPTFILFYGGTGRVLQGARSAEQFVATLQQQLESAKAGQ